MAFSWVSYRFRAVSGRFWWGKRLGEVMDGEDKIVESMRRFANDAKCVEYLQTFKEEPELA